MNKLITTITLLCFSVFANADPITYICAYPTWSDEDGNHPANDFNLTFIVDSENETAYMLGNLGTSEITFFPKITGTNFLDMSNTGNIYTTTIDDNLNSVHSRNTVILGQLLASQYYGGCTVME